VSARASLLAAALLAAAVAPARAGQTCTQRSLTAPEVVKALELGGEVAARLPAEGAAAMLLGRVGSDVSRHGLRWTHAGLVYRTGTGEPWRVLHKLNRCGSPDSDLFREGLANFFLDDPYELRALLLVPEPALQQRLLAALDSDAPAAVHERSYSMLAYPFAREYQNSNQWLLEFVAFAAEGEGAPGRKGAQRLLKAGGYVPGKIRVSAFERIGAALFRANIAFTDHPTSDRMSGRYRTVTVESLQAWMERRGWLQSVEEIRLEPEPAGAAT
jgi:hypothetical protein